MMDARTLTLSMSGRWFRYYGVAACPICQREKRKGQAALTLTDGRLGLLLHCKKSGCAFRDILTAARVVPGDYAPPSPHAIAQREAEQRRETEKRERQAHAIWSEAQPITGTPAETYLRGRSITCALPDTLRFHPACWHGATASRLPAMVARVDGGKGFSVHRTYLRADGNGKAPVEPAKAMLGAVAGGAVRLSDGPSRLVVGEGIESALSLLCGLVEGPVTAWAALSTSGLRGLCLPAKPGRLTIACDGDAPGRSAANDLARRAYQLGWQVQIFDPGTNADWNDALFRKRVAA